MTDKQIEKIRLAIRMNRAALTAEKRKLGGFDDSVGRRYYISDLYMRISDYKGAITYKKWFDKNFPDDIGGPLLSINWSIAYFELGQLTDTKIYTIDTAFHNVYLHGLLLDRVISRIDMYENGYDTLEFAKSMVKDCKKVITRPYLDWLKAFIDTDEYKNPVNKYIALNKLLKDEHNFEKRSVLVGYMSELENMNKNSTRSRDII